MFPIMQRRIKDRWSPIGHVCLARQDYYQSRPATANYTNYWRDTVDPDGNKRQRISEPERLNYLSDIAHELEFVRSLPPGNILDIGCGPGWFLDALGPAWRRLGLEISEQAELEMYRLGITNASDITLIKPDWADVVMCYHVIEHIADPIEFIGDIRRVLRPGGWLILGTPDFASPCAKRFGNNYRMFHDPTHCSLFTLDSMHRFLRDFGFAIHDVRFPFPDRYATQDTWNRWHDTSKVSPPWPGNWMTFHCTR